MLVECVVLCTAIFFGTNQTYLLNVKKGTFRVYNILLWGGLHPYSLIISEHLYCSLVKQFLVFFGSAIFENVIFFSFFSIFDYFFVVSSDMSKTQPSFEKSSKLAKTKGGKLKTKKKNSCSIHPFLGSGHS